MKKHSKKERPDRKKAETIKTGWKERNEFEVDVVGTLSDYGGSELRSESRPDAPDRRGEPPGPGGGGASYALDGLALQERENILAGTVLATGKQAYCEFIVDDINLWGQESVESRVSRG